MSEGQAKHIHDWQDQCDWFVDDVVERPACTEERERGLSVVRHTIKAIHGSVIYYDDGSRAFRVMRNGQHDRIQT